MMLARPATADGRGRVAWLGAVPATRIERRFDGRLVRCFVERPHSLHQMLQDAHSRSPDGEAIVCGDLRLTYRDLDAAAGAVAAGLARHGIGRGDRVALLLGNRAEFVVVLFAAARLGASTVPLNIRDRSPGIRHCLSDAGAKLVVHEAALADLLPLAADVPALRHRIAVGEPAAEPDFGGLDGHGSVSQAVEVGEEDVVAILYTSGTTGRPKGAMLTHLGIVHSAMHYEACMGLTATDRLLAAVPLSHVTGLVALVATAARVGGALVIMPSFRAADFLALAARERITQSLLVPAMYKLCLLEADIERHDLARWRVGGYGGAPMAAATIAELARRLPGLRLMNAYGATETTSPATLMPPSETAARPDSVGRPVPCATVLVMDEEGREAPHGAPGEVWIGGPMVVPGYWNDPQATAAEFVGGFWKSGDIGTLDEDGFLRVFDRRKDVINRGGYKIYSVEVEGVLMAHPDVVEAAVVGAPCPVLGERPHAFVVAEAGGADPAELTAFCAERLADYKVPESIILRDAPLPRNANGKLMKRELREALAQMAAPEARGAGQRGSPQASGDTAS